MAKLSALLFILLSVACVAQVELPPTDCVVQDGQFVEGNASKHKVTHKLTDEFAKAGIKAAGMIASDVAKVSDTEGSIADADANARSDSDQAIVSTLRYLFLLKRTNIEINNGETRLFGQSPRPILDCNNRACLNALTAMLRARSYTTIPKVCGK